MRPTYRFTSPLRAALLTFGLLAAACGDSGTGTVGSGSGKDDTEDDDDTGERTDASSAECTTEGQERTCSCASGSLGIKTCKKGKYSTCDCTAAPRNDAGRPVSTVQCKAGYYVGNFTGLYRPGAFSFGGIFPNNFEVMIEGGKSWFMTDKPPLSFTLTAEYEGSGEFQTFTVGGGCMQGVANALGFTQSPFVARLTGKLDCSTGAFTGMLDGYYTLIGIPGADFDFRGPLTAQFERLDNSLQEGAWKVSEPMGFGENEVGGGNGTWGAMWDADRSPMTMGEDPCATVDMRRAAKDPFEGATNADGGVP